MNDAVTELKGESYFSLESFKKNGQGVRTPLWFVERDGIFYFLITTCAVQNIEFIFFLGNTGYLILIRIIEVHVLIGI